jgi:hypothetical protein
MELPSFSRETFTDNWITVLTVFTLIIIILIIVYVIYKMNMSNLQSVMLSTGIVKLETDQGIKQSGYIPNTVNGQEFSYSFWLFVADLQTSSASKLIWYRSPGNQVDANPIVYMHPGANKLTIMLKTSSTNASEANYNTARNGYYTNVSLAGQQAHKILKPTIEYLPLQRWVHVAVVVQDDSASVYMDGSLYSVDVVTKLGGTGGARPVFKGTSGTVNIGKPSSSWLQANAPVKGGYLSKLEFYNYALMPKHVQRLYHKGPIERTWLSWIGLPGYRFQNPLTQA